MAKITRATQKQFGSGAGTNELAKFGSLAAAAPVRYSGATVTPANIQALTNFLTGWSGAVIGGNSPAIEDMNSLCYLFAYQLGYLLQDSVAEWDAGTTYYINSYAKYNGVVVKSLTDTNLNNTPSVTAATSDWSPQFLVRPNLPTVGQQVSSSSGSQTTTSTSYVDCTNQSVTLTTTGRPVLVFMAGDQLGASSGSNSCLASFQLLRGASSLNVWEISNTVTGASAVNINVPPSLVWLDTGASAGSNTYKFQMLALTGSTAAIFQVKTIAFEL